MINLQNNDFFDVKNMTPEAMLGIHMSGICTQRVKYNSPRHTR